MNIKTNAAFNKMMGIKTPTKKAKKNRPDSMEILKSVKPWANAVHDYAVLWISSQAFKYKAKVESEAWSIAGSVDLETLSAKLKGNRTLKVVSEWEGGKWKSVIIKYLNGKREIGTSVLFNERIEDLLPAINRGALDIFGAVNILEKFIAKDNKPATKPQKAVKAPKSKTLKVAAKKGK